MELKNIIKFFYYKIKDIGMTFEDYLSIVCIAKYEADYVKEWIDYHLLIGVDRIYFYDNESPDNTIEILRPYIESGKVVYHLLKGRARQLDAYNDAIIRYAKKTKYMAFIDLDEFLVLEEKKTLKETIDSIMRKDLRAGGVAVNWRVYGSSGHIQKPSGLVIENYLYRGSYDKLGNDHIKTIANPRFVDYYIHVHFPQYKLGFYNIDENGNKVAESKNICKETKHIRINHYLTKSKEECLIRRSREKADATNIENINALEEFAKYNNNDIYDDIMLKYTEKLKQ